MATFIKSIVLNQPQKVLTNLLLRTYSSSTEVPKFETLAVSVPRKHVYQVELNRPDKLNTFNRTMWQEINDCFKSLNLNPECRIIVLTGQGKHFTAGIDIKSLVELATEAEELSDVARKARFHYNFIKWAQESISSLEECVKPVISLTHKACLGAGINLISAADMRYCTEDCFFSVKEVEVGLAPDVGALQRFPKVIGNTSIARELCFTGRNFDAKEALELGFVSKVFPDKETGLDHVLQLAESIAAKSPVAVQTAKLNLVYSQSRPNKDGLEHILLLNSVMNQGEDLPKAAIAQVSKSTTPPEFENL